MPTVVLDKKKYGWRFNVGDPTDLPDTSCVRMSPFLDKDSGFGTRYGFTCSYPGAEEESLVSFDSFYYVDAHGVERPFDVENVYPMKRFKDGGGEYGFTLGGGKYTCLNGDEEPVVEKDAQDKIVGFKIPILKFAGMHPHLEQYFLIVQLFEQKMHELAYLKNPAAYTGKGMMLIRLIRNTEGNAESPYVFHVKIPQSDPLMETNEKVRKIRTEKLQAAGFDLTKLTKEEWVNHTMFYTPTQCFTHPSKYIESMSGARMRVKFALPSIFIGSSKKITMGCNSYESFRFRKGTPRTQLAQASSTLYAADEEYETEDPVPAQPSPKRVRVSEEEAEEAYAVDVNGEA